MPSFGGRGRAPQKLEPAIIAGRVPPHDLDAEAAVLSAVCSNRDALDRVLEILKPEHFYSDANGRIFEAAHGTSRTPARRSTSSRSPRGCAIASGSRRSAAPATSRSSPTRRPRWRTSARTPRVVYEKWRLRQLIATCQRVSAEGYGDVGMVQEFIDCAEQAVYELARTDSKSVGPAAAVGPPRGVRADHRGGRARRSHHRHLDRLRDARREDRRPPRRRPDRSSRRAPAWARRASS